MNIPGLVVGGKVFRGKENIQENCGEWGSLEQLQWGKHCKILCHFCAYYIGRCRIGNKAIKIHMTESCSSVLFVVLSEMSYERQKENLR